MSDLDAFLAGIVADPHNALRWLVMADYLEENGQPDRAELVRVHRELLRTCTEPDAHPERPQLHARMMELMRAGAEPCLPQRIVTLPGGVELRMSFIPPGAFLMGSPESEVEREGDETLHRVMMTTSFWLGQTPVTQSQWRAVMGTDPSHFKGDELPVEQVSCDDAQEFCLAVKERTGSEARLPTEAEWEYACRAGTTTPYYWGEELNGTQANCDGNYPSGTEIPGPYVDRPTTVGRYEFVSPHPWGLSDTHGNIWEWCSDLWEAGPSEWEIEPTIPDNEVQYVRRGGSWFTYANICRAACQRVGVANDRNDNNGFRLAATPSPAG